MSARDYASVLLRQAPPDGVDWRTMSAPARGLLLGVVAVAIFALSVPMTRLATGSVDAPQLAGAFVAFGRAVVAGVLSVTYLLATRAPRPTRADRLPLAIVTGGSVIVRVPPSRAAESFARGATRSRSSSVFFAYTSSSESVCVSPIDVAPRPDTSMVTSIDSVVR